MSQHEDQALHEVHFDEDKAETQTCEVHPRSRHPVDAAISSIPQRPRQKKKRKQGTVDKEQSEDFHRPASVKILIIDRTDRIACKKMRPSSVLEEERVIIVDRRYLEWVSVEEFILAACARVANVGRKCIFTERANLFLGLRKSQRKPVGAHKGGETSSGCPHGCQ